MARNTAPESETVVEKVTRARKSPAEKAQTTLDQAQKRYDKAVAKREKVSADIAALDAEVNKAGRFLDFAKSDPDLPQTDVVSDEPVVEQQLINA